MKNNILLFMILISLNGFSQDTLPILLKFKHANSIQVELGGPAGIYSLNYERILINRDKFKTCAQVGFSFWATNSWRGIIMPVSITELVSFNRHHLEFGFAASPSYVSREDNTKEWDFFLTARLGYRYQKPMKNFLFRAGFTPIVYPQFGPWAGISFGYAF